MYLVCQDWREYMSVHIFLINHTKQSIRIKRQSNKKKRENSLGRYAVQPQEPRKLRMLVNLQSAVTPGNLSRNDCILRPSHRNHCETSCMNGGTLCKGEVIRATNRCNLHATLKSVVARITTHLKHCHATKYVVAS